MTLAEKKARLVGLKDRRNGLHLRLSELSARYAVPHGEKMALFSLDVDIQLLERQIKNEETQEGHVCGCDNTATGEVSFCTQGEEDGSRQDVTPSGKGDTASHAWRVSGCYEEDGEGLENSALLLPR